MVPLWNLDRGYKVKEEDNRRSNPAITESQSFQKRMILSRCWSSAGTAPTNLNYFHKNSSADLKLMEELTRE